MNAVHISHDPEVDITYLYLVSGLKVARTIIVEPGILLDVSEDDTPIGIERFGQSEVPEMKLICLGVNQADLAPLHQLV